MRKHQENQKKIRENEEKERRGERYDRQRLEKVQAPSFVAEDGTYRSHQNKGQLLLSIEVSISPTKQGRIGIKEGDDPKILARNFCKTYNLPREMEDALIK